jgi:hypothetical protein
MFQNHKKGKCHISNQNIKILGISIISVIYLTFVSFIVNIKLNHTYLEIHKTNILKKAQEIQRREQVETNQP